MKLLRRNALIVTLHLTHNMTQGYYLWNLTGVKLKDSPFIKDNNETVVKSLNKLDKDYKGYVERIGRDGLSNSGLDDLNLLIRQGVK